MILSIYAEKLLTKCNTCFSVLGSGGGFVNYFNYDDFTGVYICQNIKLNTLNMCTLLYVKYINKTVEE